MATYSIYKKTPICTFSKFRVHNTIKGIHGRLFLLNDGCIVYGNYFTSSETDGYLGEGVAHDSLVEIATGELHELAKVYKKELVNNSHVIVEHPEDDSTMGKLLSNKDIGLE